MPRKRVRLSQRQRSEHPNCVYCGGKIAAVQVDHVPPIAMFALKHRPPGLEFSACKECHEGTRNTDSVAALTARSWPNLATDEDREELGELMGGVLRNVWPVREELARGFAANEPVPEDVQAAVGSEVLVTDFSVRRAILEAFGARIGMALYYEMTGRALPEEGGVWARAFTNVEHIRGSALPDSLDGILGPTLALMQKGLRAEEDFQVAMRPIDDYDGTTSFSMFRESFAILSVAYADAKDFPPELQSDIFRPGFLIGFPV